MTKSKINQEIKNKLFSSDQQEVITGINTLKDSGNKSYLPLLFELLVANPEAEVEKEILKLLGTIKDKETIITFTDALKNNAYKTIRKPLLIACWQNGLDFSQHMDVFVDLVITEDWEVAFEAFTVIENLEHFPPENELKPIMLKIASALKTAKEQKAYFLEEILKLSSQ